MADIYLHSRLAEAVIKNIDYKFNEKIVFNAAQGPDPFYYNFFSEEAGLYRKYANLMHDKDTYLLLKNMTNYVKDNLSIDSFSFLTGFICHYALDVKIHPYVYHKVGVYKKNDSSTHAWRGLHLKFERSIDAVVIEEDTGVKAGKINLNVKHFPIHSPSLEIMKIMEYVLKETYNKDNGGEMYLISTNEMSENLRKFVNDKYGFKKVFLRFMNIFNKKHDLFFQDLSMFNHIEKNYDFLNKEKNVWYHPVTNEEYNYSVMEIYDQAVKFASNMIEKVMLYIFEKIGRAHV